MTVSGPVPVVPGSLGSAVHQTHSTTMIHTYTSRCRDLLGDGEGKRKALVDNLVFSGFARPFAHILILIV